VGLRKICVVKGSNPFRANGNSVGRVHSKMERLIKPAVRFRTKNAFILSSGMDGIQKDTKHAAQPAAWMLVIPLGEQGDSGLQRIFANRLGQCRQNVCQPGFPMPWQI